METLCRGTAKKARVGREEIWMPVPGLEYHFTPLECPVATSTKMNTLETEEAGKKRKGGPEKDWRGVRVPSAPKTERACASAVSFLSSSLI